MGLDSGTGESACVRGNPPFNRVIPAGVFYTHALWCVSRRGMNLT
jgi:hypothetical protein